MADLGDIMIFDKKTLTEYSNFYKIQKQNINSYINYYNELKNPVTGLPFFIFYLANKISDIMLKKIIAETKKIEKNSIYSLSIAITSLSHMIDYIDGKTLTMEQINDINLSVYPVPSDLNFCVLFPNLLELINDINLKYNTKINFDKNEYQKIISEAKTNMDTKVYKKGMFKK